MPDYYHFCAHEQFRPRELLLQAIEAERAGFDGIGCSDHLQPWWEPGESGHAWVWLGAAGPGPQPVAPRARGAPPRPRPPPAAVAAAAGPAHDAFPGPPALGILPGASPDQAPPRA